MDERAYLKVKIKSLAEEAKIIRLETKHAKLGSIRLGLYLHRIHVVRPEARHTHLAYGFLRGREYHQIEPKAHTAPNWKKVRKMVEKYGTHSTWEVHQHTDEWNTHHDYLTHMDKIKKELLSRFDKWVEQAQVVNEAV